MTAFKLLSDISARAVPTALLVLLFLLATPLAAQPVVFTVGPAGSYPDLNSAIADALNFPAPNEIRIQEGPYPFAIPAEIPSGTSLGGHWSIHGGWDPSFTNVVGVSILDGGNLTQLFRTGHVDGDLLLVNLIFENGHSGAGGGGAIDAELFGTASLHLFEVLIRSSTALAPAGPARGGCLRVRAFDQAHVQIHQSRFLQCQAIAHAGDGEGGALYVALDAGAHLLSSTTGFHQNHSFGNPAGLGAALFADVDGDAVMHMSLAAFTDNFVDAGAITDGAALVVRSGSSGAVGNPLAIIESSTIRENLNLSLATGASQATLLPATGATLVLRDSLVVDGNDGGVRIGHLASGGRAVFSNLTVSGHPGHGIAAFSPDDRLFNTIAFGNGNDALLAAGVVTSHNLIGVDPMFIDPAAGDYGLQYLSPAIDAGDNIPPAGLSVFDALGQARVFNHWVDIGAIEATHTPPDLIFRNGFQ